MEIKPFVGSFQHTFVYSVFGFILDDVNILKSEALAGTQYSTGILRLINIFQDKRDVPRTHAQDFLNKILFVIADVFIKVGNDQLVL
jgi:hypothetical protein